MLQKIDGARRILYKNEEIYVMSAGDAKRVFPNLPDVEGYTDETLIFINGVNENKHGICASSDDFDDDELMLFAEYGNNALEQWEPFRFTPILVGASCLFCMYSSILEDDHLRVTKDLAKRVQDFIEYVTVSTFASIYFHTHTAISLLFNGISDYSEVVNGAYQETRTVTEWGNGEENANSLGAKAATIGRLPMRIGVYHQGFAYLQKAASSPEWQEVPYIKLFINRDELPV